MKELRQGPGVRLYKGEDFLALQELTLRLTEQFYGQFGNLILSGCGQEGDSLLSGIVLLDGKACVFAGATGVASPFHVKKVVVTENVPYKTGEGIGFESFVAEPCAEGDEGAFRLDTAQRLEEIMGGGYRNIGDGTLLSDLFTMKSGRYYSDDGSAVDLLLTNLAGGLRGMIGTIREFSNNELLLIKRLSDGTLSGKMVLTNESTGWNSLPLVGDISGTLRVRLNKTGYVEMEGNLNFLRGFSSGETIATLPEEYKSTRAKDFVIPFFNAMNHTNGAKILSITANATLIYTYGVETGTNLRFTISYPQ
jgi:hypothetical protein